MPLLLLDPSSLDDKNDPVGSYKIKLKPADYDIKVTASEGYEVSADGGETYSREIVVKPNPGQRPPRIEKTLLVRKSDPFAGPGSIRHVQLSSQEEDTILPIGVPVVKNGETGIPVDPAWNGTGGTTEGPIDTVAEEKKSKPVLDPKKNSSTNTGIVLPEKQGKYRWLMILLVLLIIGLLIYYFASRSGVKPVVVTPVDSTQTGNGKTDTTGQSSEGAGNLKKDSSDRAFDSVFRKKVDTTLPPANGGNTQKTGGQPGSQRQGQHGHGKRHDGTSKGDDGPTNDPNHIIPNGH